MAAPIDLARYELGGRLGSGADYEVRAATDRATGQAVVVKRPVPQAISRRQHEAIEARTTRLLESGGLVGPAAGRRQPALLGGTARAAHDAFFGDQLGETYTVIVQERAGGIPLLGDMMARVRGVPIAAGQGLFALFPLMEAADGEAEWDFPVQRQLLELAQLYLEHGWALLDLRPQNVFFQPGARQVQVIDTGAAQPLGQPGARGRPPADANDVCLELLKFYATPEPPPLEAVGYRDARGIRPIINWQQELDEMARNLLAAAGDDSAGNDSGNDGEGGGAAAAGMALLDKLRARSYADFSEFGQDFTAYLEALRRRNRQSPDYPAMRAAWQETLAALRADYWRQFQFDADAELAGYINNNQ